MQVMLAILYSCHSLLVHLLLRLLMQASISSEDLRNLANGS